MWVFALAAPGCIGGQTGSESKHTDPLGKTEPCDPLAPQAEPIALGEILGIGRAADGILYVADEGEDDSGMRAFVSAGDTLVRQRVSGTGSSHDASRDLFQLLVEGTPGFRLVIERRQEQTRMARAEGGSRVMEFDELGAEAELLEVLSEEALDGLALRNLPGDVTVEYFARDESGKLLLVLLPVDDVDFETDVRLFYGSASALIERKITAFERQRDGGTTHILFELDHQEADAFFPIVTIDRLFMPGPATLTIAGDTIDLERLDAAGPHAALLNGAQLRCFVMD